MEAVDKVNMFKEALSYIEDENIKHFAIMGIGKIPDYFFVVPASSTGKYHPEYSLGEGGLFRHTLSAIRIAVELSRMEYWGMNKKDLDLIIASLIFHDAWKHGIPNDDGTYSTYTLFEHPNIAYKMLSEDEELKQLVSEKEFDIIVNNVKTHMGQWTFDKYTQQELLEKPSSKLQKIVHLADYLASRKCLTMNFDVPLSSK